jgi:hypothetical protein
MTLLDVKARQLALATLRIEALLRQAWEEAQSPAAATRATTRPTASQPAE